MIEHSSLISFLVILIIVAISPFIARRIRIPTIVLEVAIGLLLGKSFLNFIREDQWIEFFSFIGLIYLLFLGGLEINIHEYLKNKKAATIIALASLLVPATIAAASVIFASLKVIASVPRPAIVSSGA